jgi:hypothetical protein
MLIQAGTGDPLREGAERLADGAAGYKRESAADV